MVTVKQAWVGLLILLLVTLLVLVAAVYWHHVTGVNYLHVMASIIPHPPNSQGC